MPVRLRLFAQAREAAACATDDFDAHTLDELLTAATARYGDQFAQVLRRSRIWLNGDDPPQGLATALKDDDEVAVLPPVSGG